MVFHIQNRSVQQAQSADSGATVIAMADSYHSILVHCVFSTKGRAKLIDSQWRAALWSYLGGIARKNGMKALAIGGTDDHVHILLSVPPTLAVSKAVQLIKGGSSKWVHDTHSKQFEWQPGYGAFSVGISQQNATKGYIEAQEKHHARRDYRAEFIAFLERHGVEYDPRHVVD